MDIEQIGLFVVGWFAVGFIVALGLGKILREANNLERGDTARRTVTGISRRPPARYTTHPTPLENKKTPHPVESGTRPA